MLTVYCPIGKNINIIRIIQPGSILGLLDLKSKVLTTEPSTSLYDASSLQTVYMRTWNKELMLLSFLVLHYTTYVHKRSTNLCDEMQFMQVINYMTYIPLRLYMSYSTQLVL